VAKSQPIYLCLYITPLEKFKISNVYKNTIFGINIAFLPGSFSFLIPEKGKAGGIVESKVTGFGVFGKTGSIKSKDFCKVQGPFVFITGIDCREVADRH
jgi:hypothetical protein